ncbi:MULTISPECIES: ParB/RepB/Spo0J family partition protein [Mycolicibacterium]|uniref:ParB/RepB/Spo0J family partition protein n=1 Tax=Mycolicibacterium TaxID=1866885 RepID=UPI0007E995E7|nr:MULTISPECIES: ParB/RepB/Spo0J family partition protein [Mycolicibacterium]MCA4753332.1 ParB/RepB/Spo0J family partition protein [Mycolicibacterium fortuitum]MDG5770939.1 ParB/RepB/Spo0J family partition protein [Mycolicibacterium fortuitum]MDG5782526.1 ParB/RepB/Spo0J family partition protein [Mycolicibacterium fortuitum]OBB05648.1 chromosome partitioning protein ParB [Mycolicibacterium fortuitum]OBK07938.1 chromosome partitioning protein ParB [Mycolicibacterium fortuitum]
MNQPARKRSGLGRGLAALIPTGPAEDGTDALSPRIGATAADVLLGGPPSGSADSGPPATAASTPDEVDPVLTTDVGATYREIDPNLIQPNPRQPRQVFDEEALSELVHSIREFGLMQPIVVRAVQENGETRYQLVMGERRWRAAQEAGLEAIPAIVRETADDSMLRDALLENIHRVQLNPLEEAAAYQQLLDEFEVTHDELAARIGRSRPLISNMIRLLRLPIAVQRRVAAGVLSAGHARALLALEGGAEKQEELAARIVAEGMSVRATEEAVTLANRDGNSAPPAPRRKPIQMPGLQDVAEKLSSAFDTRVTVSLGKRKGKIVVEFGSVDDLQRIVEIMSAEER